MGSLSRDEEWSGFCEGHDRVQKEFGAPYISRFVLTKRRALE